MSALGHPERAFASALVAGTNGKGSVSAYLDAGLRAAGLRVGRYTSPHLIDIRERITVDGKNIGNKAFEALVLEIQVTASRLKSRALIPAHPNHFEILTAAAFLYFRRCGVEVAVLEVGLGGRLDATNVASPLVSAIVSIDFDHEEYLGQTLGAIAREKAGVLRKNRIAVVGPMAVEASATIERMAASTGARLQFAFEDAAVIRSRGDVIDVRTPQHRYSGLVPLPGMHQRTNLMVAIRTIEALQLSGLPFNLEVAVAAMSGAVWPGRLEGIGEKPRFLLDGAHNPAGALALSRHLQGLGVVHTLVFGAMRDKHVREMAAELFPGARRVIATRVRMARAASTAELAEIGRELGVTVVEEPSIARALLLATSKARPGETIVVAGSLYLVGAVRKKLLTAESPRRGSASSRAAPERRPRQAR